MNIILAAVPFFFLLIALELVLERFRGTNFYRVNDSVTSLTTGVFNQLIGVIKLLVPFTLYLFVFDNFAHGQMSDAPWVWVLAFVLYDFFYYWNHRFGHEMNILWAAHVVHHNSEDYNLSTALRQTGTSFASVLFYMLMALMGFDPLMVLSVGALNLVYQFWVHTQHIPKLGWFEWVFVSPSNHRVHHAQNAVYIDRNYGGVFIVWDRLFGSFQEELDEEPVVFGITGALRSWNPLWANFQVYTQLFKDAARTQSWWYKLTIWFRRTGWRPPDVAAQYPLQKTDIACFKKFDTEVPTAHKVYALLQYLLISVLVLWMMLNLSILGAAEQLALAGFVLFSGYTVGALMEQRDYAVRLEQFKLLLLITLVLVLGPPQWLILVLFGIAVTSTLLLFQKTALGVKE